MNWISVNDALPQAPIGKHAIKVLVCIFDPIYEELCPKLGLSVADAVYGYIKDIDGNINPNFRGCDPDKFYFQEWYNTIGGAFLHPMFDRVTHWMYYPDPPDYDPKTI